MAKEIITDISALGLVTQFEITSPTAFNVKRTQDIGAIIEANKRDQIDRNFNNGYTPSRDMKHVARIPLIVLEQWAKDAGIPKRKIYGKEMNEVIRKNLNDPANLFFRTGLGEV